jgi:hypothetical protein
LGEVEQAVQPRQAPFNLLPAVGGGGADDVVERCERRAHAVAERLAGGLAAQVVVAAGAGWGEDDVERA